MRRPVFAALCAGVMLLTCGGCGDANTESSTVRMEQSQSDSSQTAETTAAHTSKATRHTTTSGSSTVTSEKSGSTAAPSKATTKATAAAIYQNNSSSGESDANTASDGTDGGNTAENVPANTPQQTAAAAVPTPEEPDTDTASDAADDSISITLNGNSAETSDSSAVSISGSCITIQQAGKYTVSGTLSDGQIIVNVSKEDKVNLHLNGADIFCSGSAPLYIVSADTCTLHLDSGSVNYLTDTAENALSACLFSKDDLTIKGDGALVVSGNRKHGIKSNNDLKIKNGALTVTAVSTGIYGEDSIQITGGSTVIASSKDGFKVSNTENAEKGFFYMEGGSADVQNAAGNGIEAVTGVTICGGSMAIHSAKKAVNCDAQSITEGCLVTY